MTLPPIYQGTGQGVQVEDVDIPLTCSQLDVSLQDRQFTMPRNSAACVVLWCFKLWHRCPQPELSRSSKQNSRSKKRIVKSSLRKSEASEGLDLYQHEHHGCGGNENTDRSRAPIFLD